MAAAREAILTGDLRELEELLVGRRIWIDHPKNENIGMPPLVIGPYRVLSFKNFLTADPPGPNQRRKKHLVQVRTDPGGTRTLSVGSIRLRDPRRQR